MMTLLAGSAGQSDHPPKPRLALSVGVIGHRPKDLAKGEPNESSSRRAERRQKVEDDIRTALDAIAKATARAHEDHHSCFDRSTGATPLLTVVSALAEGADTIAAEAALSLGYALDAPLPFARDQYIADFTHAPADEADPKAKLAAEQETKAAIDLFNGLCKQARAVLELPGQRRVATDNNEEGDRKENRAYEAVGLTVLSQADIVLAIWDREPSRGRGGTAEMVAEAARAGIPIVLVDANGERPVEVHWRSLMEVPAPIVAVDDLPAKALDQCIDRVVDELVRLPMAKEQRQGLARWLTEMHHCVNFRLGFPILAAMMFARRVRGNDVAPRAPKALANDYVKDSDPIVHLTEANTIKWLAEPYGWADAVGFYFAQYFRSAFVMNFLFAACAVVAASASVMVPESLIPAEIEVILIVYVVVNTIIGRRYHWHRRWVEAREIAERLRVALPLWALGLRPGFFPGEEATWTGWYARAVVRMQGMRAGNLASGALAAERTVLLKLLNGQRGYNEANADRMRWLERGLELVGICFLALTGLVAFDHVFEWGIVKYLLGHLLPMPEATIWLSAALPALATATYGIRVIGDFEGIFHRSRRTQRKLEQLAQAVEQDPIDLTLLRARASSAVDVLLGDVASWRLAAESRGLAIPG